VMENCWQHLPPFYAVDDNRTASCFLYKDCLELDDTDVARVFVERSDRAEQASQVSVAS
jgi:predicted RNA-binding protein with PIN domain